MHAVVRTGRRLLSQILINLTSNASKFTGDGSVRVEMDRAATNGSGVTRFRVIDTGRGIKDEDQLRLSQAFEQLESEERRVAEGAGLGLHMCRRLAALIDGSMRFNCEYGRGITFKLALRDRKKPCLHAY
jgi:two-component system, sensor histidine kinase and response regulator